MSVFTPLELADDVFGGLHLLVIAAGCVLVIVSWRRQPRVALFALLGLVALLVAYLLWFLEIFVFPHLSPHTIGTAFTAVNVVTTIARLAGFALLLLALLRRRQAATGAEARR